jgi:hypothetical protein
MDVRVTVLGGRGADDVRDLGSRLSDQEELRGRISVVGPPAPPEALGDLADTVVASIWLVQGLLPKSVLTDAAHLDVI